MKKVLSADFRTRLWETVKSIEQDSQVEVVMAFRANSGEYNSIPLAWGALAAWITHTYMIYAPDFFENWLIYYIPPVAFFLGFGIAHLPSIKRLSCKKSVLLKNVEIMARKFFKRAASTIPGQKPVC